jgi:hypothetical protein
MRDNPLFTPESGHEMAIRDLREPECRFGAKNIRFAPKSGYWMTVLGCPLRANSGHHTANRLRPVARRVWREGA